MILLFHWISAYCKTIKRIGTLNFTNINLPFVVRNLRSVCLSIARHTTQGYTGCHKHVYFIAWFDTCDIQMRWHARSKRICGPGYFNNFVQHSRSYANIGVPAIWCSRVQVWELGRCCNKCRWQDFVPNRGVPMGNRERPTWSVPMILTYWCIFWHFA